MLQANGDSLIMQAGDFGLSLPFRITGGAFLPTDTIRFTVEQNGRERLRKDYGCAGMTGGAFLLAFTQAESALLPAGDYEWYMTLIREEEQQNTFKGPCLLRVLEAPDGD